MLLPLLVLSLIKLLGCALYFVCFTLTMMALKTDLFYINGSQKQICFTFTIMALKTNLFYIYNNGSQKTIIFYNNHIGSENQFVLHLQYWLSKPICFISFLSFSRCTTLREMVHTSNESLLDVFKSNEQSQNTHVLENPCPYDCE